MSDVTIEQPPDGSNSSDHDDRGGTGTGPFRVGTGLANLTTQLMGVIDHALGPGDLAALRRLSPHSPWAPVFWRLLGTVLQPEGFAPSHEPGVEHAEKQWASILRAMAHLRGLHRGGRNLGAALAEARYSELRGSPAHAGMDPLPTTPAVPPVKLDVKGHPERAREAAVRLLRGTR